MRFEKHNANPLNKKTGDCVVRALSFGLRKGWLEVYDDLVEIGRALYELPSAVNVVASYLETLGYHMKTLKAEKGVPRKKVRDFTDGTYILRIANHITVVQDGVLYDAWDCRNKAVYRYWKIKERG